MTRLKRLVRVVGEDDPFGDISEVSDDDRLLLLRAMPDIACHHIRLIVVLLYMVIWHVVSLEQLSH